ncbi:MAG: response regulator transcription factor [Parasporobacterium sp.]|nr:response regulator transcription factor [Parasporobacterium sp.]
MYTINIAIIEDNAEDLKRLNDCLDRYMQNCKYSFTIHHFSSGESFLASGLSFHLVFMDIELPGISGLETSERLRKTSEDEVLVLVTNMIQYAIHGYAVKAADYIVKPVMYEQLSLKMPDYLSIIKRKQKSVLIRQNNSLSKIYIHQIRFIEVFRHDVYIQLENEKLKCRGTLKEFEDELDGCGFVKCSQSCLVNLGFVQGFVGDQVMVDGHQLPMSRREKKSFSDAFIRFEKEW